MKPDQRKNLKITSTAQRLIRLIAATTGETQFAVLERLLTREWERLQPQTRLKESS